MRDSNGGQSPAHVDSRVEGVQHWLECVDTSSSIDELVKWLDWRGTFRMRVKELSLKVFPIRALSALKAGSAFKLANAFWHRSVACMLLQKCLLCPGKRGAPKLRALDWTPGEQRSVLSLFLCALVSDGSLYESDSLLCTTPQSGSGKGAQWKGFAGNPNQLFATRPPMCEETEGLCQKQSQWADLTSGDSQARCNLLPDEG